MNLEGSTIEESPIQLPNDNKNSTFCPSGLERSKGIFVRKGYSSCMWSYTVYLYSMFVWVLLSSFQSPQSMQTWINRSENMYRSLLKEHIWAICDFACFYISSVFESSLEISWLQANLYTIFILLKQLLHQLQWAQIAEFWQVQLQVHGTLPQGWISMVWLLSKNCPPKNK